VSGVWGDKPLAILALWQLAHELLDADLAGTVTLLPAANPAAIAVNSRINPDHVALNRTFPGGTNGPLTNQIADLVVSTVLERSDCVIDLHSGTATMGLGYIYDYGDLELSASFGYLPVVPNFGQPGQLSTAVTAAGGTSALVEFGGGERNDLRLGVEGCLNVLAYRGHIDRPVSGPSSVPVIDRLAMYMPSVGGILGSTRGPADIGQATDTGLAAWVHCPGTGERVDEFTIEEPDGILLLANTTPLIVDPGAFGLTVGYASSQAPVRGRQASR
jgi:predicted deacylase